MVVEITPSIVVDPASHSGKPFIQGTQAPVEEVIAQLAAGMTVETVIDAYQITPAAIQSALEYVAQKLSADFTAEVETVLAASVQAGQHRLFVSLVETIDWSTRQPHELTAALDLALSLDMTKLARKLAALGGRLFPDHDRVQRAAYVLAPSVVRVVRLPRAKGLAASRAWLRTHGDQYRGEWVAVREGKLLGAAKSLAELEPVIGQGEDAVSTIVTRIL